MATGAITPPAGYTLEGQAALPPSQDQGPAPPPGYSLETATAPADPASTSALAGFRKATDVAAVHEPRTFIGKFARWTENVSNDIKYGTDETGIGTMLKKMGAHGVYGGNPEAVGEFVASLPLGLLKASKGASEIVPEAMGGPKGKTFQGLEDLLSGGLQAATMPGAFVAPEAGELAAELGAEASGAATGAARAVGSKAGEVGSEIVHGKGVAQPSAQAAVRAATGSSAEKVVSGATGESAVDGVIENLDKMRRELYQQASQKAGFDVSQAKDELTAAQQRLQLTEGTDAVDIAEHAKQQISELTEKLHDAQDSDPALHRAADAAHGKYAAAVNFRKALVSSTDVNGEVNIARLLQASKKLRFTKYGDQLEAFLGKGQADQFMQQMEAARDMGAHAVKMQNLAKWALGLTAAAGTAKGIEAATK